MPKPTPTPPLSPEEIEQVKANCPSLQEPHEVTPALERLLKAKAELEEMMHPKASSDE